MRVNGVQWHQVKVHLTGRHVQASSRNVSASVVELTNRLAGMSGHDSFCVGASVMITMESTSDTEHLAEVSYRTI
jgi:hypothetical protein